VTAVLAPEQLPNAVLKQMVKVLVGAKCVPVTGIAVPIGPAFVESDITGNADPPTAKAAAVMKVPEVPPNITSMYMVPVAPAGTVSDIERAPPPSVVVVVDVVPTPPEQPVLE